MAFREIPEIPFAQFLKMKEVFAKIGDKFLGIYQSDAEGAYGQDYIFTSNIGDVCLTLKGGLHKQLQSAGLNRGDLVAIQYRANKDTGKESPMRLFKVAIDSDWGSKPAPKNGPNVAAPVREDAPTDEVAF